MAGAWLGLDPPGTGLPGLPGARRAGPRFRVCGLTHRFLSSSFLGLPYHRFLNISHKKVVLNLGHFQVGSYRYRSLLEGLYAL